MGAISSLRGARAPGPLPARCSTRFVLAFVLAAAALTIQPPRSAGASTCTGVQLNAGASLQSAINANGTGTTFCINDGTYTTTSVITPKSGDLFIGVYGDGSQPNISNIGSGGVFSGGTNVLYQGLGIGSSSSTGVNPGDGSMITGDWIHDNKGCGIETAADHLTITGNEIGPNNGSLATKGDACGVKLHGTSGSDSGAYNTVTNNTVHDNTGHGLWVDCDGHDNTISANTVYNNAGSALDDETAYNNTWTNNIVHDNGFGWSNYAFNILDTIGTTASANTFTNNWKGITISQDSRATRWTTQSGLGCADATKTGYHPFGISFRSNTFTTPQRSGFASSGTVPVSAARFDYDSWTVATMSDTNWRLPTDSTSTWSQWIGAGEDPHGKVTATG